jgi:hypothetical protein
MKLASSAENLFQTLNIPTAVVLTTAAAVAALLNLAFALKNAGKLF